MTLRAGGSMENMSRVETDKTALESTLGLDKSMMEEGLRSCTLTRTDTVPNEMWLDKDLTQITGYD